MTSDLSSQGEPSPSDAASAGLGELKSKVAGDLASAKDTIKEEATHAVEKVKDIAAEKTNVIARQVSGLGSALEKVATELENSDQPQVGQYAKQIGATVKNFAQQMEGKDLGGIASMAEDFGRKQPVAFLGVAALAGFAASRFLTASANRATNSAPQGRPQSVEASAEGGSNG